jgi:class 3 adenylate cyclase
VGSSKRGPQAPTANPVWRWAREIVDDTGGLGLDLRIGIHTGKCETRGNDLGGLAFHIAARVSASAEPGEILISRTVVDLVVGSGLESTDRGDHNLKACEEPGSSI